MRKSKDLDSHSLYNTHFKTDLYLLFTGGVAPSGPILQKPSAVLPVHCITPSQQWWSCLQQREGNGDKVRLMNN